MSAPIRRRPTAFSRRRLITGAGLLAVAGSGLAVGCSPTFSRRGDTVAQTGAVLPSVAPAPTPYTVELPRVAVAAPTSANHYAFTQRVAEAEILPGLRTTVWGYDGQFPGPTIEARRGRPITVTVRNELPTPTSTHLHGGVTPAESDGPPTDLIMPTGFDRALLDEAMRNGHAGSGDGGGHTGHGSTADLWTLHDRERDYHYPIDQDAALLWYHDHRMDFSAPQVWRGLAGMAVIRDDHEDSLGLPDGEHELLLMLTDRSFGADGELLYPALDPTLTRQPGVDRIYMDGVLGDVMLVNGAPFPITRVAATAYRLRLVNGCNARPLRLRFRPTAGPDLTVQQIGTDIGLLPGPVDRTLIELHPGERVDLVVDLSALAVGTEVELTNDTVDPADPAAKVMKLAVVRRGSAARPVPERLAADFRLLRTADAVTTRSFDFRLAAQQVWTVNGQEYDPTGSIANPAMGTIERWTFTSDFNHPVHLHLGHFQVVSVDGKDVAEAERGWKDTVNVTPFAVVEVLVRFPAYRGRYMLHCHNLEHEDMAMMANVDVT